MSDKNDLENRIKNIEKLYETDGNFKFHQIFLKFSFNNETNFTTALSVLEIQTING